MRILTIAGYHYYGDPRGIEPQFYYLYRVPQSMGHDVDFFDWYVSYQVSAENLRRQFLAILRGQRYDAVFLATHRDEFDQETLAEAQKYSTIIAFNSDDEDRWENYSQERVGWYSYMVTNSPVVYETQRHQHPNLLHAQWACCGFWDGRNTPKDIDVSFVGQIYGTRASQIEYLRDKAGLQAFGKGLRPRVSDLVPNAGFVKTWVAQRLTNVLHHRLAGLFQPSTINFEQVNALWNRTRVSFTPLESSRGKVLQIKSRVFDMGLSGTLMLAPKGAGVEDYYEPNEEFVEYETLDDFVDRARFYCQNEAARAKIAAAYARRTEAHHLWRHRIEKVLMDAGIQGSRVCSPGLR